MIFVIHLLLFSILIELKLPSFYHVFSLSVQEGFVIPPEINEQLLQSTVSSICTVYSWIFSFFICLENIHILYGISQNELI